MNRLLFYIVLMLLPGFAAMAQSPADTTAVTQPPADTVSAPPTRRFITPVKENTNKTLLPGKNVDDKVLQVYLTGDTAKMLEEERQDSIKRAYIRYPIITDMTVGFNFLDLIMGPAGQDYMNIDASFALNMWNRLQPIVELGVGWAKDTPDDLNYTYKGKMAPYMRIGASYNITFKSSPDYQGLLGVRLGGTVFNWELTDIQHTNTYWGESLTTELLDQSSHALWLEVTAGLKVKIWRRFSLGWTVRYHNILSEKSNPQGKPWFIPGYGTRSSKLGVSVNAFYTLPGK